MALTRISTTSGSTTSQADKSISISHYNSTDNKNHTYYTVPVGRKFKGIVWVNDYTYELGKLPGHTGSYNHPSPFGASNSNSYLPIETGSGDFVSGNSSYSYHSVVGIETDA